MAKDTDSWGEDTWDVVAGTAQHAIGRHPLEDRPLSELTQKVNELHAKVLEGVRTTLIAAKDCGALLLLCKKKAGHGNWTTWLDESFAASEYTAQRYMRIARDWHLLETSGFLDGPDQPGVAMADEYIRELHGGQKIPSGNKPPPSTRKEWIKNIAGTISKVVEVWPDEAVELLEAQIVPVIDSIEVYMQEQYGKVQFPEVLPSIAIRKNVEQMALIRLFAARVDELDEVEKAQLLQRIERPGALKELAKAEGKLTTTDRPKAPPKPA